MTITHSRHDCVPHLITPRAAHFKMPFAIQIIQISEPADREREMET